MDEIVLRGMQFYGRHGVNPAEKEMGQRFIVHLVLGLDVREAAASDDVRRTVNYAQVYRVVQQLVEGEPVRLIETLAERIAGHLLDRFPRLLRVQVEVEKPGAPIPGIFSTVSVRLERRRGEG
ncbi:MAG: dihydroneopterin aldolase [Thermoflavifilum sp.]|nr:dihydroneopterin aldolase [Thermoflavifilum sp.]MCL6513896.1 dihydroneopterin aldolase [Alicyclobacillus sp.]